MITADYAYNHIDWEHSPVGDEPFDHYGNFTTNLLNLGITIGLNDYWNATLKQLKKRVLRFLTMGAHSLTANLPEFKPRATQKKHHKTQKKTKKHKQHQKTQKTRKT